MISGTGEPYPSEAEAPHQAVSAADDAAADPTAEFSSSATMAAARPAAHSAAVPAPTPVAFPADDPADDPAEDPADDPADDPAEDPADDPADDPAEDPTDDPAEDPTDDPADDPAEDPADDPAAAKERWLAIADYAIQCLSPDAYFNSPTWDSDTTGPFKKGQALIRGFVEEQRTVRSWELSLKAVLVTWASRHATDGLDATANVLRQLKELSQWKPVGAAQAAFDKIKSEDFYHMLKGLDKDGMLPILTFSFDRRKCERLASKKSS